MYFVCAAVSCCCILGTLALSETKGTELQDKIEMTIVRSDRAVNGVTRSDDHL
ncbi:hypothetical protein DPMN_116641 [Dreissena polymorpha]|uniref:Uncharacterized protein n=2 Tax=Dreissena polymorpha TaxID=45954 RepID=A0A9D4QTQ6_DREPO|nr:hypothetical protein DPMN_115039 [Dreissena polymorpha]KAH3843134.1 hypothetical protein DPMN_116641 [Dreissena polymorpha]